MPKIFSILKDTAQEWVADGAPRLGAALAYYSLFSIGPLLLIAVSVAGLVFGREAVSRELFDQLQNLIGTNGARTVSSLLEAAERPMAASIAGMVGIVTLLVGATGVVVQLKDALNIVWDVKPKPGRGIWIFLRKYIISLAAILGFGFLLMISLVASAALAVIGRYFADLLPAPGTVFYIIDLALSFSLLTLLMSAIFKYLPDVDLRFRDVLPGAGVTVGLFLVGKYLIGMYLGRQSIGSAYGAAGSVVVLLIWIYYSAQIVFFGAEFTQVYCRYKNVPTPPTKDAEPASETNLSLAESRRKQKQVYRPSSQTPVHQP